MKPHNWTDVAATSPEGRRLPEGWYVMRVVSIEDFPSKEYLKVCYEVAEGPNKDFFKGSEEKNHTTFCSYKSTAAGMFKGMLEVLENSNSGFSISQWQMLSDEKEWIGLLFGCCVVNRLYTSDKGEDRSWPEVRYWVDVDAARDNAKTGKKLPEPRDNRTKIEAKPADDSYTNVYWAEVPF